MNRLTRMAVWIGGGALLLATVIDTMAVIGRHVGLPLTGSIELMQAVVLLSGGLGLVIATASDAHARVRLLVDRLAPGPRQVLDRLSDLLTFAFFAALLAGSGWIMLDLWDGHEQSELLGVPWRALRLLAAACLLSACLILVVRIVRGGRR